MKTKMRLITAPLAVAFGIGAMPLTSEAQTSSRARDNDSDKRRCGRVFAINPKNQLLRLDVEAQTRGRGDDDDDHKRVRIKSRLEIKGLTLGFGEILVGIDFRPATGQLYGLGLLPTPGSAAGSAQLYIIDTERAVATPVGAPNAVLVGTSFGFDFNPVPDRIRVVSNLGQNLRLNPDNGAIAGTDTDLAYAAGDPNAGLMPSVVGVAYTNPDRDPLTNTVLYDIDSRRDADPVGGGDVLAIQVPPNGGQLNTVGRLRINTDDIVGFDISHLNAALAALQEGQTSSRLVSIDLISGRATDRGRVGELLTGLAIELGPQCDANNSDRGDDDDSDR